MGHGHTNSRWPVLPSPSNLHWTGGWADGARLLWGGQTAWPGRLERDRDYRVARPRARCSHSAWHNTVQPPPASRLNKQLQNGKFVQTSHWWSDTNQMSVHLDNKCRSVKVLRRVISFFIYVVLVWWFQWEKDILISVNACKLERTEQETG